MTKLRRVSANNTDEAREVAISGESQVSGTMITMSVDRPLEAWPSEVDFITYARDDNGSVIESSRVVWRGTVEGHTSLKATRVGGATNVLPAYGHFATVVPSHVWANDIVDTLRANIADDGAAGLRRQDGGNPLVFSIGASSSSPTPSAIPGRTIVFLKPL
ncbi:MAG: hypothetical protein FWD27_00670 [Coriobacteriia bacterium]|nr:hypothetical protein [Coriobacteriia bacterium]